MTHYPPPARQLTVRDREVLWLMSKGMTYMQVGRRLGMAEQGAKSAARRVMHKMGVGNIVQAVAVGLLEGHIGRWQGCGTHAAYQRHRKLHHTADPACLMAKAAHERRYRAGGSPEEAPAQVIRPEQEYRRADNGKHIRIEAVDPDGVRVDAVDVSTGRPTRILTDYLYASRWTRNGKPRRYGYVLTEEQETEK